MTSQNSHTKIANGTILVWALKFLLIITALCSISVAAQNQRAPASPSKEPGPVQVEPLVGTVPVVTPGVLIKRVAPKYPKQARKKHIEGTVIMKATITRDGDIADLQLVSGDPLLAQAALDAVKNWKYRPYLKDGQPVEADTQITVNFALAR